MHPWLVGTVTIHGNTPCIMCNAKVLVQWNLSWETTPWNHRKWSYMTGGLSSQEQMYRNVGSCYCNSGCLSEVSLITMVSLRKFYCITMGWYHSSFISDVTDPSNDWGVTVICNGLFWIKQSIYCMLMFHIWSCNNIKTLLHWHKYLYVLCHCNSYITQ